MIRKIFIGIIALIVLILAAVVILPVVYKGKIVQLVKDETNKNLNAIVNFGEFDITIIRSFPDFSLSINDLSVAGKKFIKNRSPVVVLCPLMSLFTQKRSECRILD